MANKEHPLIAKLKDPEFINAVAHKANEEQRKVIENKNAKLLASFTDYCRENSDQRFWQALVNWSGHAFIFFKDHKDGITYEQDTYNLEIKG